MKRWMCAVHFIIIMEEVFRKDTHVLCVSEQNESLRHDGDPNLLGFLDQRSK